MNAKTGLGLMLQVDQTETHRVEGRSCKQVCAHVTVSVDAVNATCYKAHGRALKAQAECGSLRTCCYNLHPI